MTAGTVPKSGTAGTVPWRHLRTLAGGRSGKLARVAKEEQTPAGPLPRRTIVIFGVSIFLSAFLLFQVQPMFGRFILPRFGGSPEVWTTCMLFFQLCLLGGYAYSHVLVTRLGPRMQALAHGALLVAAGAMAFFIIPSQGLALREGQNPVVQILWICTACIGLPYFALSATGPLLQGWLAAHRGAAPYRLYALSNAGSLLGLLTFPFIFEPLFARTAMAHLWTGGFVMFAVLCGACALIVLRGGRQPAQAAPARPQEKPGAERPHWKTTVLWIAMPLVASTELLAVTNKITQDVAATPFLWVLPLGLYLLSFILCFDHPRWYRRGVFAGLFVLAVVGLLAMQGLDEGALDVRIVIGLYCCLLFACCMLCHGEVYKLRPPASRLTRYYLMIAAGGAAGGVFVGIIAPMVFDTYYELHLGLLATLMLLLVADTTSPLAKSRRRYLYVGALMAVGVVGTVLQARVGAGDRVAVETRRNFFGVLTVWDQDAESPQNHKLVLMHGTTVHGLEFFDEHKRLLPTAYYGPGSGIGRLMAATAGKPGRRIGIVGLGVGTLAAYGRAGDVMRFYEINPEVYRLASENFEYLSSCRANVQCVLGDARLSMEAEQPQRYDILVLDAFSSDSVPAHLLTSEAMDVYLRHLAAGGVLAFHASAKHLDLESVLWKLARHASLQSLWIEDDGNEAQGTLPSEWILLSRDKAILGQPAIASSASAPYADLKKIDLWTDDHINVLQILRADPRAKR